MKKTISYLMLAALTLGAIQPAKAGSTLNWAIATAVCGVLTSGLYYKKSKLHEEFNGRTRGNKITSSESDYKNQLTKARDNALINEPVNPAGLHLSSNLQKSVLDYNQAIERDKAASKDDTAQELDKQQANLLTALNTALAPYEQMENQLKSYARWAKAFAWTTGILGFLTLCSCAPKNMLAESDKLHSNPAVLDPSRRNQLWQQAHTSAAPVNYKGQTPVWGSSSDLP